MIWNIVIPGFGATGGDVVIERWLVAEGDLVEQGQAIFVVSTDKAEVEVEAFRRGYLRKFVASEGESVSVSQTVAVLADTMDERLDGTTRTVAAEPGQAMPADSGRTGPPRTVLDMFRRMVLIRRFEDHLYQLFLQGLVPGTLHQCQGQEAVAVGVCSALRNDDLIFSTHRPVGHFLAKGCPPSAVAAEIWGKVTGCSGGKGGQMHLCDMAVGAPPSNAIVGANVPIATGAALGIKLRGLDRVAVCFFGDGAANNGPLHEGINLAAIKNAPVVFVCENNLYGASTHQSLAMRIEDIADRAAGYGIPGVVADGMDVMTVRQCATDAVSRARGGNGPTLIEYKTYRYQGHSRGDPGGYRSKAELESWKARDPIICCRRLLTEQEGRRESDLDAIEAQCQSEVEQAVTFAQSSPEPAPQSVYEHVLAEPGDNA